ncbi:MAG: energy transducer TonB [Janthinobacterium lividum]
MQQSIRWCLLLAVSLSLGYPQLVHAQTPEPAETTYSYADQLPALPGGGGTQALESAIRANFHFPADAPAAQQVGAFGLDVILSAQGDIVSASAYDTKRDKIKPSVEAAACAAARRFPRFRQPAYLNGQPIQFSFKVLVTLTGQPGSPLFAVDMHLTPPPNPAGLGEAGTAALVESATLGQVYTYAEQMPVLPDAGGNEAISRAIGQRLTLPYDMRESTVYVRFIVNKKGAVAEPTIVKGATADADAAVLAAVRKLPRFIPGKQHNQPVNVQLTMRVAVVQPRPQMPAPETGSPATSQPRK